MGGAGKDVQTRSRLKSTKNLNATIFEIHPKTADEALKDKNWTAVMIEEPNQFEKIKVLTLVLRGNDMFII